MKGKKSKNNDKEKSLKEVKNKDKESLGTRFIDVIKKRWLITGTNTMLLIAILIAIVILLNKVVQSFELTPIDCTSNKEYTLTDESKQRISNIEDSINIYMVGFEDGNTAVSLAKQYGKSNEKINIELIDLNERKDIAQNYNLKNGDNVVIVENGERSKVISANELYTYDSSYNTIDITEEKITSAILNVTAEKIPKVYFLEGYSQYKLDQSGGMYLLSEYLKDEVLEYTTLNLLTASSIPDDCDTLVITTPEKDFDELTTNQIIEYINKGGNIFWLNSCYPEKVKLTNVNKVLELYGINPFEVGYIYETDNDRIALGYSSCIFEDLENDEICQNLSNILLLSSTKINVNKDKLSELGVTEETIVTSSDKAYFRKDVSNTSESTSSDEQGPFTIAGIYTKKISNSNEEENDDNEEESSKLIIFGDNNFITDIQVMQQVQPMIFLANNKDVMLNSLAYLTEQKSDITIRKDYTKVSSFTATDGQKLTIIRVIFIVPIAVMVFGIIVWQVRRRKK